jgi:uncharacterized protein YjlB
MFPGAGPGAYIEGTSSINTVDPIYGDIVMLYPHAGALRRNTAPDFTVVPGTPAGWAVLRFVADNYGVWPVHCTFIVCFF